MAPLLTRFCKSIALIMVVLAFAGAALADSKLVLDIDPSAQELQGPIADIRVWSNDKSVSFEQESLVLLFQINTTRPQARLIIYGTNHEAGILQTPPPALLAMMSGYISKFAKPGKGLPAAMMLAIAKNNQYQGHIFYDVAPFFEAIGLPERRQLDDIVEVDYVNFVGSLRPPTLN